MILRTQDFADTELVAFVNQGEQSAFNSLLIRHLPIIHFFGKRYFASGLTIEDLQQAGSIGLFIACKKYSETKGMAFSNFAKMHIKHHMVNAVVTSLRKKQQFLNHSISLDQTIAADQEKTSRYEMIPHLAQSPEEIYMDRVKDKELLEMLKKHLTNLERTAVLGLMDDLAYKEIAELAGVCSKSIDNALRRAKGKLKAVLYNAHIQGGNLH